MNRLFARILVTSALVLAVAGAAQEAAAEAWRDVATGRTVSSGPVLAPTGSDILSAGGEVIYRTVLPDVTDPKRAFDPRTGRNFAFDQKTCTWIDVRSGQRVSSGPVLPPTGSDILSAGGEVVYRTVLPDVTDPNRAFDARTGRNFVRVDCPSTKTAAPPPPPAPKPTQQVGMVIEPRVSIGIGGLTGSASYESTGGQTPFTGDFSQGSPQLCGGAAFWPGLAVGPASVGVDVNVCSGTPVFGAEDFDLFRIQRHGTGDVALSGSTGVVIDALLQGEVPIGPAENFFFSAGIGPTFRQINLRLTSDQTFFGGGIPSTEASFWQAGLGLSAGIFSILCSDCAGGNPLKAGIEGRARFFASEALSLTSPAFGFTETAGTGPTADFSVRLTLGVPVAVGR